MDKFFANLWLVVLVGFGLAVVLTAIPDFAIAPGVSSFGLATAAVQWIHVFFGILWIGLLYYFNFVQMPTMPKIPAELKPAVGKHIAPAALFWFRWAALATVLLGLAIAGHAKYLGPALGLQDPYKLIGVGMWLGLIMAFNVWFLIWPNQKKALGIVEADDATKAKAARTAMIFSRTNTLLSIPMLYAMVNFS